MKQAPLVSVVIPSFNRPDQLRRALRSVLEQSLRDFEVIVVDDASEDPLSGSVGTLGDPRVRYVRHEANRGAPVARNTGIAESRGEFLAYLDSDDEWHPSKLEVQSGALLGAGAEVGAAVCGYVRIRSGMSPRQVLPDGKRWSFDDVLALRIRAWATSLIMVRNSGPVGEVRFDEVLPANQDWDYLLRVSAVSHVRPIPENLVTLHSGDEVHIASYQNVLASRLILHEKYEKLLENNPRARKAHELRTALAFYHCGDPKGMRRFLRRAAGTDWRDARIYLWYAGSLLGDAGFRASQRITPLRRH